MDGPAGAWGQLLFILFAIGAGIAAFISASRAVANGWETIKLVVVSMGMTAMGLSAIGHGAASIYNSGGYPFSVIWGVGLMVFGGFLWFAIYHGLKEGYAKDALRSKPLTPASDEQIAEWDREDRIRKDTQYIKDEWRNGD